MTILVSYPVYTTSPITHLVFLNVEPLNNRWACPPSSSSSSSFHDSSLPSIRSSSSSSSSTHHISLCVCVYVCGYLQMTIMHDSSSIHPSIIMVVVREIMCYLINWGISILILMMDNTIEKMDAGIGCLTLDTGMPTGNAGDGGNGGDGSQYQGGSTDAWTATLTPSSSSSSSSSSSIPPPSSSSLLLPMQFPWCVPQGP